VQGGAVQGTACYWFGGSPGNPYASLWLKLGSSGQCSGCTGNPTNYCTAGTTSNGCTAHIQMMAGTNPTSATSSAPSVIEAIGVEGAKQGLIFYGCAANSAPWGTTSSFLCVKAPTQRTPAHNSGGTADACDGRLAVDINGFWSTNPTALGQPLYPGAVIYYQAWFRDPPNSKTTSLSDAMYVTVCP